MGIPSWSVHSNETSLSWVKRSYTKCCPVPLITLILSAVSNKRCRVSVNNSNSCLSLTIITINLHALHTIPSITSLNNVPDSHKRLPISPLNSSRCCFSSVESCPSLYKQAYLNGILMNQKVRVIISSDSVYR